MLHCSRGNNPLFRVYKDERRDSHAVSPTGMQQQLCPWDSPGDSEWVWLPSKASYYFEFRLASWGYGSNLILLPLSEM
ncbi:hypothetical protein TNCV_3572621 [Trichonephila clavipes]|nr:hypothetical protein TNCV_3572621 [Trichonephila clavipes]